MKKLFTILALAVLLAVTSVAQDINTDKLDSIFVRLERNNRGMGSISVFDNGNEIYQRSYGYYDLGNSKRADKQTKYRIGSISKTFTAAIIMQMVEEGLLKLDDMISVYFPEIPNAEKISIRQLLNHRSGIKSITAEESYFTWNTEFISRTDMLEKIKGYESQFEPDTKFQYSNSNYYLLSLIAEKIDGKDFKSLFNERMAEKFGLASTYIGGKTNTGDNEAFSYTMPKWKLSSETDMSVPLGAGAVVSTPDDVNRFFTFLLDGKIISEGYLEEMLEMKDGYGLGIYSIPYFGKKAYGHNGGIDGFASTAGIFPDEGYAITLLSNAVDVQLNDIMLPVLGVLFKEGKEIPDFAPTPTVDEAILNSYVGLYKASSFPLDIEITESEGQLFGQATGQSKFPLEAVSDTEFRFTQAGVTMIFDAAKNKMSFQQGGVKVDFFK